MDQFLKTWFVEDRKSNKRLKFKKEKFIEEAFLKTFVYYGKKVSKESGLLKDEYFNFQLTYERLFQRSVDD